MLILCLTDTDYERRLPFACVRTLQASHVADIEFSVVAPSEDDVHKLLKAYPRKAEPAIALVARCLALVGGSLPFLGNATTYHLQLLEGDSVQGADLVETLDVEVTGDRVRATWEDASQKRCIESPGRQSYPDAGHLLEHGARLVAWCVDDVPPMPPPLDISVTVRENKGIPWVDADDIPGFARSAFSLRQRDQPRPGPGAFYAHDWFDFLTS